MKRFFVVVGGGFLLGAFLGSLLSASVMKIVCLLTAAIALFSLLFSLLKKNRRLVPCLLFLGCFLISSYLYYLQEVNHYLPLRALAGEETTATATVSDISTRQGGKYTYLMQLESVPEFDITGKKNSFLVYTDKSLGLSCGDTISATMQFYLPAENSSTSLQNYYKSDRIFLCASIPSAGEIQLVDSSYSFRNWLQEIRLNIHEVFQKNLSADSAAVLSTMILGIEEEVSFSLRQNYMDAGFIHLFAISGIHMVIFSAMIRKILSLLFRKKNRRNQVIVTVLTIGCLASYLLLSGLSVSAARSAIMISVTLIGNCFDRPADSLNSLFFAAFLIVLQNVYAIIDIGFLMSFSSCLGVILCSRKIAEFLSLKLHLFSALARRILESLSITFSANLFLLPIFLVYFGYISIAGFLANLIAVYLTGPILTLGFAIALSLGLLPNGIMTPIFKIEDLLLTLLNETANAFGKLPFASIGLNYREIKIAVVLFVSVLSVCFLGYFLHKYSKPDMIKGIVASAILIFGIAGLSVFLKADSSVYFYFVGDGTYTNCIISGAGQTTVISSGDDNYIDELTRSVLRQKNIRQIDNLIFTYPNFHAYQDTVNLLNSLPVTNVFYPEGNIEAQLTLEDLTSVPNLFPIGKNFKEIHCGRERAITITSQIKNNAIALTVSHYGNDLFFFGTEKASFDTDAPVLCLRSYTEAAPEEKTILLLNRYIAASPDGTAIPVYQTETTFILREEQLLSSDYF